eukprot:XP_027303056.1 uncharacterized protein C2orf78-like [Anas platyrhynchos]
MGHQLQLRGPGAPAARPHSPEPAQAPRTASTQTATPDAATAPQVPEEPPQLPELGPDALAEAFPELAGDSQQLQHVQDELLAHLDIPIPDMEELLSWLDAVEPQDAFPICPAVLPSAASSPSCPTSARTSRSRARRDWKPQEPSPPGCPCVHRHRAGAKRPAPSSTPGTAQSCQHRRPTTENPPRKERKMLLGQAGQGRKRPCQGKTRGSSTVAGSSREAGSSGQQLAINSTTAPASGAKTLEESVPITPQQRPERERLKKLAQEERQRAAHQMKIGPVQFFVQRQKDHARAYSYGYP